MLTEDTHLHESLGAAGQLAVGTQTGLVAIHVDVHHALIEAAHGEAVEYDLSNQTQRNETIQSIIIFIIIKIFIIIIFIFIINIIID